jgi:hypothetical protein
VFNYLALEVEEQGQEFLTLAVRPLELQYRTLNMIHRDFPFAGVDSKTRVRGFHILAKIQSRTAGCRTQIVNRELAVSLASFQVHCRDEARHPRIGRKSLNESNARPLDLPIKE